MCSPVNSDTLTVGTAQGIGSWVGIAIRAEEKQHAEEGSERLHDEQGCLGCGVK